MERTEYPEIAVKPTQTGSTSQHTAPVDIIIGDRNDIAFINRLLDSHSFQSSQKIVVLAHTQEHCQIAQGSTESLPVLYGVHYATIEERVRLSSDELCVIPASEDPDLAQASDVLESIDLLLSEQQQITVENLIILGAPFLYPESLQLLLSTARVLWLEHHHEFLSYLTLRSQQRIEPFTRESLLDASRDLVENTSEKRFYGEQPQYHASSENYQLVINWLNSKGDIDFYHYRQSWVAAHIEMRKAILACGNTDRYIDHCLHHSSEYNTFINAMVATQNIDLVAFKQTLVLMRRLAQRLLQFRLRVNNFTSLRVWIPGCGTGTEAYLFAMSWITLCKASRRAIPLKIFATDINESALKTAGKGLNCPTLRPKEVFDEFTPWITGWSENCAEMAFVRKSIIFSMHDLTKSPALSQMDAIICRDVLWMFKTKSVNKVLTGFHHGLIENGFLLIDASDQIAKSLSGYTVEPEPGLFHKARATNKDERYDYARKFSTGIAINHPPPSVDALLKNHHRLNRYHYYGDVMDQIIDEYAPPGFLVDENGEIIHIIGDPQPFTSLYNSGSFSKDLTVRLTPALRPVFVAAIAKVFERKSKEVIEFDQIAELRGADVDPIQPCSVTLNYYEFGGKPKRGLCGIFFTLVAR